MKGKYSMTMQWSSKDKNLVMTVNHPLLAAPVVISAKDSSDPGYVGRELSEVLRLLSEQEDS